MRFVTLFAGAENMHIVKDVGLLPYYLYKECGVNASIACYNNGEYPFIESDTPGLGLEFFKKTKFGKIFDGIAYLKKNAVNIDVLNIYHLNLSSFFYAYYFRMKNKNGRIYLKLDMDHFDLEALKKPGPKRFVKNLTIKAAHLISCESTFMKNELEKLGVFKDKKLIFIPNGLYRNGEAVIKDKENTFFTAARLGSEQKATDVLLEAFAESADKHDWKLKLAGTVEPQFNEYIENYFAKYPDLKARVEFLGMITDKTVLEDEYSRASVFVLPSRWESFGLVLAEAAVFGCYLVATDVIPPLDDITDNGKYGVKVSVNDVHALAKAMENAAKTSRTDSEIKDESNYILNFFDWTKIIKELYSALEEAL